MAEADIEGEAAGSEVLPESESAPLWCWECWFQSCPAPGIHPVESESVSHSVVSDSLLPDGL